jgi:hypothetical protein
MRWGISKVLKVQQQQQQQQHCFKAHSSRTFVNPGKVRTGTPLYSFGKCISWRTCGA